MRTKNLIRLPKSAQARARRRRAGRDILIFLISSTITFLIVSNLFAAAERWSNSQSTTTVTLASATNPWVQPNRTVHRGTNWQPRHRNIYRGPGVTSSIVRPNPRVA